MIYNAQPGDTDQIAAFETATTIRFTRFGGASFGPGPGCNFLANDSNTIDCVKDGVTSVVLNLGDGDDVASINPSLKIPVIFNGADGRDGLFGGGGIDIFDGGPGDDNVISRDDRAEQVTCGDGHDTAISDDSDARGSCEEVQGDADGDGVRHPVDCDDTNPNIHPGAVDVPENGIDEDCSGVDAVDLDRDGDGSPRPQDCDDTVAAVHPGATEVIGNAVDENCDGRIEPYPPLTGSLQATWKPNGKGTRNVTLLAKGFPASAQIVITCHGSTRVPEAGRRPHQRERQAGQPARQAGQANVPEAGADRGPGLAGAADRSRAAVQHRHARAAGRRVPLPAAWGRGRPVLMRAPRRKPTTRWPARWGGRPHAAPTPSRCAPRRVSVPANGPRSRAS